MQKKKKEKWRKNFLFLTSMDLKMLQEIAFLNKRIFIIGIQWVNKES